MSEQARVMPQSLAAEMGILGALLVPGVFTVDQVHVVPDAFYQRSHRIIFETILSLSNRGAPVDSLTVTAELERAKVLEEVGGSYYISKLANGFPTESHLRHFEEEMNRAYRLRGLLEIGAGITNEGWEIDDSDAYIAEIESKIFKLAEKKNDENLLHSSGDSVIALLERIKSGEGIGAMETGIEAIDKAILGVCPGMMDVYAAEAGAGKTSLIEQEAVRFLCNGDPIAIFQKDMTAEGFYLRLACRLAGTSVSQIRRHGAKIPDEVDKAIKWARELKKTPLLLYSPSDCTGQDIRRMVRRDKRRHGIKLVIVDHIRTIRHSKQSSWEGLVEVSDQIRKSVNDTGVCHQVLAHINREGAKSARPTISDIKGGDQLKDDADNCCVLWPENQDHGSRQWQVNFGFDKTRWDAKFVTAMNYYGPKMSFEPIPKEEGKPA